MSRSSGPAGAPVRREPRVLFEGRAGRFLPLAIAVLAVLYLLQSLSPIRLDNDSVVYLRIATAFVDGVPSDSTGMPVGYPAVIAGLDRLGLGWSFVFVLVNCTFVALGLASVWYLYKRRRPGSELWVVVLTMLSWPLIRFVPMHLPETMFFGVSLAGVTAMSLATSSDGVSRRVTLLVVAVALTALAITVRLVGLALVPALVWACFQSADQTYNLRRGWIRRDASIALAGGSLLALISVLVLGESFRKYAREFALIYLTSDMPGKVLGHIEGTLDAVGEIVINLPASQFRGYEPVFVVVGGIAVTFLAFALRWRRPHTPVGVYLVSFLVLLVLWPYNAVRLWLPVIPLIIGYAGTTPLTYTPGRWRNAIGRSYAMCFALAGLVALGYTTRITFSGKNFSKVYGKAGGMSVLDRKTGWLDTLHDARARELMKRYGNPF